MLDLKIYQIYYRENQLQFMEPEFQPYYNPLTAKHRQLFEYSVFSKEYEKGNIQGLTGYVSWKFKQKTNLNGRDVFQFIANNVGYDVYTFNPFFELPILYSNVWQQGELHHPGIIELAQSIYNEVGFTVDLATLKNTARSVLYCNYWIGSKAFWDRYMPHLNEIATVINIANKDKFPRLYTNSGYHDGSTYVPFILERVFSTFLEMNPDITVCPYPYTERQKAEIVVLLREAAEREFDSIFSQQMSFRHRFYRFAFQGGFRAYNWRKWLKV